VPAPKSTTLEQEDAVVEILRLGASIAEAERVTGLGQGVIRRIRRNLIPEYKTCRMRARGTVFASKKKNVLELWRLGLPTREIAERLGVSVASARGIICREKTRMIKEVAPARSSVGRNEGMLVNAQPFRKWLESLPRAVADLDELGVISQSDYYWVMDSATYHVGLDFVDRTLTLEGSTELWEMYPDV
jgi:hypothetical protein